MEGLSLFIDLNFIMKIGFILMTIAHLHLKLKGQEDTPLDKQIVYWKEKVEFMFSIFMAILIIYLFNPIKPSIVITGETKTLLFLFGIILLITAKWNDFLRESLWFQKLQKIIGKNN